MTRPTVDVHDIDVTTQGSYDWETGQLVWRPARPDLLGRTTFDPTPAYEHDLVALLLALEIVTAAWVPTFPLALYSCNRECVTRTSGFSTSNWHGDYVDGKYRKDELPSGIIVLSGKRVMPHPGMSRHLVAHEYGHHVEQMLLVHQGYNLHTEAVTDAYIKVRGLDHTNRHYGSAGRWHDAAAEIFACDFRILVCGIETEFWPHPGITRPEEVPGLADWWAEQNAILHAPAAAADAS